MATTGVLSYWLSISTEILSELSHLETVSPVFHSSARQFLWPNGLAKSTANENFSSPAEKNGILHP